MKEMDDVGGRFENTHLHFGQDRDAWSWDQPECYWTCESLRQEAQQILHQNRNEAGYMAENESDYLMSVSRKRRARRSGLEKEGVGGRFAIFTKEDVEKYLAMSEELDIIPLDHHLFCVLNTRDYLPWDNASTLAFYDDGVVLRTGESSNSIMGRIFKKVGISYDSMRLFMGVMEGKRPNCSPYTYGNVCYLPVNGPSKNPVTWVSLSHVTNYQKVKGERNRLQLEFLNRHRIELQMRPDTFESHLTNAAQCLVNQQHLLKVRLYYHGMDAIQRDQRFSDNVLQQWLHHHNWKITFTMQDIGRLLFMAEFEHIRRHPDFKDNPFTEEIWNHLSERQYLKE